MDDMFDCMSTELRCNQTDNPFDYILHMLGDVLMWNYNFVPYDENFKKFLLRFRNCTEKTLLSMFELEMFPCCESVRTQLPLIMADCLKSENFAQQNPINFPLIEIFYFRNSCCVSNKFRFLTSAALVSCDSLYNCISNRLQTCTTSDCRPASFRSIFMNKE